MRGLTELMKMLDNKYEQFLDLQLIPSEKKKVYDSKTLLSKIIVLDKESLKSLVENNIKIRKILNEEIQKIHQNEDKNEAYIKLAYDLDDYLIEMLGENKKDDCKYIEEYITISDNWIKELEYCNPIFPIYFITYDSSDINGKIEYSSPDFVQYTYQDEMIDEINNIYQNWNRINSIPTYSNIKTDEEGIIKNQVFERRFKRVRFYTKKLPYPELLSLVDSQSKEKPYALKDDYRKSLINKFIDKNTSVDQKSVDNSSPHSSSTNDPSSQSSIDIDVYELFNTLVSNIYSENLEQNQTLLQLKCKLLQQSDKLLQQRLLISFQKQHNIDEIMRITLSILQRNPNINDEENKKIAFYLQRELYYHSKTVEVEEINNINNALEQFTRENIVVEEDTISIEVQQMIDIAMNNTFDRYKEKYEQIKFVLEEMKTQLKNDLQAKYGNIKRSRSDCYKKYLESFKELNKNKSINNNVYGVTEMLLTQLKNDYEQYVGIELKDKITIIDEISESVENLQNIENLKNILEIDNDIILKEQLKMELNKVFQNFNVSDELELFVVYLQKLLEKLLKQYVEEEQQRQEEKEREIIGMVKEYLESNNIKDLAQTINNELNIQLYPPKSLLKNRQLDIFYSSLNERSLPLFKNGIEDGENYDSYLKLMKLDKIQKNSYEKLEIESLMTKYSPELLFSEIRRLIPSSRAKISSLCKIFNKDNFQMLNEDGNSITISYNVFQYPNNVVYIRYYYKLLWMYFKHVIEYNYKERCINDSKDKNSVTKENKEKQLFTLIDKEIEEEIAKELDNLLDKMKDGNISIENLKIQLKDMKNELKFELLNDFFERIEQNEQNNERKILISFCKRMKDELLEIEKKLLSHDFSKYILLRGNPGIGKTSFIIYLLYKLKDYKVSNEKLSINLYKNTHSYHYKNGILSETEIADPEIVIADSCNYNKVSDKDLLVLYISYPDVKSYEFYINSLKKNRLSECLDLYLDIFSPQEIEEWKKLCLPSNLSEYITNNKTAERYGNVPRHIYFDSLYNTYYKKKYWDEIYRKGINMVISNLGFIEFVDKYLIRLNRNNRNTVDKSEDDKISNLNTFDSTLSHYIVKYKYNNIFDVSHKDMLFISDKVIEYLFESIHHICTDADIDRIKEIFFNYLIYHHDHPLFQLFFEVLIRYKCVNQTNDFGNEIERVSYDRYDGFKQIFLTDIFSTKINGVYMVDLMELNNGDRIYLLNNCFIRLCYGNAESDIEYYIKRLKDFFNNIFLLSCYPEQRNENEIRNEIEDTDNDTLLFRNWVVSKLSYDKENLLKNN